MAATPATSTHAATSSVLSSGWPRWDSSTVKVGNSRLMLAPFVGGVWPLAAKASASEPVKWPPRVGSSAASAPPMRNGSDDGTEGLGSAQASSVMQTPSLSMGAFAGHAQRRTHWRVQSGDGSSQVRVQALPHSAQCLPPVHVGAAEGAAARLSVLLAGSEAVVLAGSDDVLPADLEEVVLAVVLAGEVVADGVGDRVHGPSVKSTWQSALARQSLLYVTPPAHTGRKMRGQGTLRRGTQSMDGTAATDDFGASHAEDVTQTPSLRIGVDGGHSQRATHCMVQMGEEFSHDGVHALPHSFQTMPPVHCLSDGGGFFGVVVINVANEVESSCRSEVSASPKVTTAMEAPPAGCCRFADVRSKVFVHGCSYT
mmetsp:Transcript_15960/g.31190  ORF Transcript_15960/g.31190 Transcript_15960/m.31190 type:complete len:370 (+) Transcript_15960:1286-2395(+)